MELKQYDYTLIRLGTTSDFFLQLNITQLLRIIILEPDHAYYRFLYCLNLEIKILSHSLTFRQSQYSSRENRSSEKAQITVGFEPRSFGNQA